MQPDRRQLLKQLGLLTAAGGPLATTALASSTEGHQSGPSDPYGVLVDLTVCVGCRHCEHACKQANGIEPGNLESYDDQSVFRVRRRPAPDAFTVVNACTSDGGHPVYVKTNCMHCNHAACVSACIVGALTKEENGAVVYDAWKCIGCRYCMVACPFQIPAYSYDDALTPEVRKCEFCFDRTGKGEMPACVEACPRQAMTFGKRKDLLQLAHQERLNAEPDRYVQHVYGEHEVGGTSWLYISDSPFEELGFLKLGSAAPPVLTEAIQHGVFKYWIAPVGWYSFLAAMMWWTGRRNKARAQSVGGHALPHAQVDPIEESSHHLQVTQRYRAEEAEDEWGDAAVAVAEAPEGFDDELEFADPMADDTSDPVASDESPPVPPAEAHRHDDPAHHDPAHHDHAAPVDRKLLTPGVWVLMAMVLCGVGFGLYRFIVGLGASTNLDQQHPWGLWIAMDVGSGIALAGGGFVTAAVVHIFHREHYHAVARSALLTALLGYTFYVPGLLADIGRWYNIWHPTIPTMWQGNSVLFEVGLCVMIYLNVQYAEMAPIVLSRLIPTQRHRPRVRRLMQWVHDKLEFVMPALLVLGVALSTFHQSSLGNLMVIAPYKLHPLWWTPVSPLLFLLSAAMVGFPMVIFTILFASWSLKRRPEMHVLSPLALYVPPVLAVYLAIKVADVFVRSVHGDLFNGSREGVLWLIEVLLGVAAPMVLLLLPKVRRSPKWLAGSMLLVILGVVLNRLSVFVLAYDPPYATKSYFPSVTEFAVSLGLVAALMLVYRIAVTYLPILEPRPEPTP